MTQQVKSPLEMPTFSIGVPVQVQPTPLTKQLPASSSWQAKDSDQSAWSFHSGEPG